MREDLNDQLMPAPATPPQAPAPPPTPAPPPSLLELAGKHKRTLLSCLGIALLLGLLAQLLLPPTFESNAQIYVQKSDINTSAPSLTGAAGLPSTHAAWLVTTPVLKAALASESVRDLPSIKRLGDRALEHMDKKLRTSFARVGETVSVTYRSRSREDSATVLRAVIDAYLEQLRTDRGALPAEAGDATPRMMDERMVADRLTELATRQAEANAEARRAATRLTQADAVGDDALALATLVDASGADSERLGAAELTYLKAELKKLGQQLESMPAGWGPEHSIRGPIQRRADAMQHEVDALDGEVAGAMRAALERSHAAAERRARELGDEIAGTQATAARVAQLPVKVIQWPEVPRKKVAPKVEQTLGIAAFGGLGLGLMLMLRRELQDRPSDAPAYVAPAPALSYGAASPVASPVAPRALLAAEAMEDSTADRGTPMLGQMPEVSRPLGAAATGSDLNDPASSIHQIRAVLQVQATATGTRAFAFTSPRRGAGKTSVALGVASSLALSGTRTLVVDCDLAGRISRSRGDTGDPADAQGPAESGDDSADLGDARADGSGQGRHAAPHGITGMIDGKSLAECVVASTTEGLSLLPAVNPQSAHISKMSDAFIRRVIDASRADYDIIIFDTGPVPGSVEALLVASQCDGVVVVVKQGEDRKMLDRTMSYLKVVGAKVTGTVFNRVAAPGDETAALATTSRPGGAPLGSGILAAAVFSDAESDFASEDFELKETSDFDGELADVFGTVGGADADDDNASDKA